MSLPTQQRAWILANPPAGEIQKDTFELVTRDLPELKDGEILVQVESLSNDPAQRGWIQKDQDPERAYSPPVQKGDIVRATAIGKVLKSRSDKWQEGQRVVGSWGWTDYAVAPASAVQFAAIDLPGKPTASLSVLGMVAVTAYHGLFDVLDLKPEHTIIVSGAAGAVGSIVVQLAKNVVGARVVGIAGGKDKVEWVKSLGADDCIDYKEAGWAAKLKAALPKEGADRVFENVGGDVLNEIFKVTRRFGKIAQCGMIAGYHGANQNLTNITEIVKNRLTIQGFIVIDIGARWPVAVKELAGWVKEGKIKLDDAETLVPAKVEDLPQIWQRLFSGQNRGKLISQLA
ncbi:hypothetical protein VHUM_01324 [Vanrija humicola]|uniref:Enoyl reductase (ER) domain-containing protein n=1 Tax=Vanrija humicola TaxID=5417 RepID=A0A7D8V1H7_VANHU|nr:hypothetical protein VHUM_01324 [Vanrija humicola]